VETASPDVTLPEAGVAHGCRLTPGVKRRNELWDQTLQRLDKHDFIAI
jgi:hypothetical protein